MENGAFPFDLSLAKQPVLEISDSEESRSKKRPLTLTCTPSKKRLFLGGIPGFAETPQDVQALLGPGFANARFAALNESATSWLLLLRRWAPSSEDFDTLWAKHPSSLGKVRLLGWRPSLFFMSSPRLSFSGPSHSFSAFSVFRGSSSERKLLFTGISNPLVQTTPFQVKWLKHIRSMQRSRPRCGTFWPSSGQPSCNPH
ncbi:unnamed protein product [Durusdinium trenchii]|uniref:Uncharacterized protein n=1 Tax=Durusdinium trenchii TaxID=1381693 RepID=A0ABP0IBS1_9DINO